MKKTLIIIISVLSILLAGTIYILIPQKVEHAVIIKSTSKNTTIYLNGRKKNIKVSNLKYKPYTVINYKKNKFKIYDITEDKPITDRVLVKNKNKFELEHLGYKNLSKNTTFYKLTDKGLEICNSNDLVIGKNNVKSFLDNKGHLSTFVISPIDYLYTRVGISTNNFSSIYHDKVQIISDSNLKLYSLIDKHSETIAPNTLINIDHNSQGIFVTINNKGKLYSNRIYLSGGNMKILNIKRGSPEINPEYEGTLEFSYFKKGLCVINELSTEDYLKKVIPSEMPDTSGIESLKCQAVAARTYAISDMLSNRFADLGFYVDDSTKSQVYNNVDENMDSNSAIESTRGIIMTYNKFPIDAKYFSTSCGTGVRYEDVWIKPDGSSETKPYFRVANFISSIDKLPTDEAGWLNFYKTTDYSTCDTDSPYFRWNIEISQNALSKTLNKSISNLYNDNRDYLLIEEKGKALTTLPKLGVLKNIIVVNRSKGGNINAIKFVFENVEVTIKGDENITNALKFNKESTGETNILQRLNSSSVISPNFLPSRFFSIEKDNSTYIIYGGGYGHGVGMSQYGAMSLSKKDWKYNEILSIYYKNITLTKLY